MEQDGPSATRRPTTLYTFPGAGDDDEKLMALRRRCAPDLDLKILHYPPWRRSCRSADTLDTIIGRLMERIEALHHPDQACHLAGFSLGGEVAYGIALRMREAGRRVAFVGLIDAQQITRDTPLAALDFAPRERRRERAHRMVLRLAPNRLLPAIAGLKAALVGGDPRLSDMTYAIQLRVNLERAWLRQARRKPAARKLDAPAVLFKSGPELGLRQHYDGWNELCAQLRIVEIDGTHNTIFAPPHIDSLAHALVSAIKDMSVGGA